MLLFLTASRINSALHSCAFLGFLPFSLVSLRKRSAECKDHPAISCAKYIKDSSYKPNPKVLLKALPKLGCNRENAFLPSLVWIKSFRISRAEGRANELM